MFPGTWKWVDTGKTGLGGKHPTVIWRQLSMNPHCHPGTLGLFDCIAVSFFLGWTSESNK